MLLLVIRQQRKTTLDGHRNFNSLTTLPKRLCVYRRIWWIPFSLFLRPSSSFINVPRKATQLVNLFMIWAELLSKEFSNSFFVLSEELNFASKGKLKTKKTVDFMPGWFERISGFLSIDSEDLMFFFWVTQRGRFFSSSAQNTTLYLPFCFSSSPNERHVAARDFLHNNTPSLSFACRCYENHNRKRRKKMLLALLVCCYFSVCLPLPMLESR